VLVLLQVEAAQLCYLVAGLTPQWWEPGARLCLLGADHRGPAACFASIPALQRTEAYEWAKLPGECTACPSFIWEHSPDASYHLAVDCWWGAGCVRLP
jgi:hypothetical protein